MIRTTTVLDDSNLLHLVKEFYPLTSYSKWAPFDDETVSHLFDTLRRRGILLVAEDEGKLIGIIAVIGAPGLFNNALVSGHEIVWWVLPAYRKTSIGIDLLRKASSICSLKGWKSFQMTRLEESDSRLDQVFLAEGFHPTEHCFTKVY